MAPRHVAIIMDGNGRWATRNAVARGFSVITPVPRRVREIVECLPRGLGVEYLTIFAFSYRELEAHAGGGGRPDVASFGVTFPRKRSDLLSEFGARVRFIGDRVRLDDKLIKLMDRTGRADHGPYTRGCI